MIERTMPAAAPMAAWRLHAPLPLVQLEVRMSDGE